MGRGRRLLIFAAALGGVGWCVVAAPGQQPESAPTPTTQTTTEELPAAVRAKLADIEDFAFDYDNPGYYALLEFVKHSTHSPGFAVPPIDVPDWREIVERPSAFRGLPITIEGVVGRNKNPYKNRGHEDLGFVWQVELSRPNEPISCTVIFTDDASDLPLGATIQVTGYFVQVRRIASNSPQPQLALLLVAQGPSQVSQPAPRKDATIDWRWPVGAVVLGLVVAIVMLRRAGGHERTDLHTLRASHEAPLNLAEDLEQWAQSEADDADDSESSNAPR